MKKKANGSCIRAPFNSYMDNKQDRLAMTLEQATASLIAAREWKSAFKLGARAINLGLHQRFSSQFCRELAKGAAAITENREMDHIVKGLFAFYNRIHEHSGTQVIVQIKTLLEELNLCRGDTMKLQSVFRKWGKEGE